MLLLLRLITTQICAEQLIDVHGELCFDLVCNRAGTKWFTKVKKVKKDYSWREFIVDLVMKSLELRKKIDVEIPLPKDDDFVRKKKAERPVKAEAVRKHQTRLGLNPK